MDVEGATEVSRLKRKALAKIVRAARSPKQEIYNIFILQNFITISIEIYECFPSPMNTNNQFEFSFWRRGRILKTHHVVHLIETANRYFQHDD